MPLVPAELVKLLVNGDVVVFCGAGLSLSTGTLPSGKALARELCTRAAIPPSEDLPAVARTYETRCGRHSLLEYLDMRLSAQKTPMPGHLEVARLPVQAVITTNWDELIERAFEKCGRQHSLVVRDEDVAFLSSGRTPVVKAHGTVSQKDSMLITDRDLYDFLGRRPAVASLLRTWFLTTTLLFVGYDLEDPDFKTLFYECKRVLGGLQRRGYAVQLSPRPDAQTDWLRENIQIIEADATLFLQAL